MAFDVEMPDGTIIEDVPDGTPKEVIHEKWQRSKRMAALPQSLANAQEQYSPTEGMNWAERGLAGAGKAFYDVGRGIGQLTGQVSGEDVAEARRLDAPLMETTAGKVGNLAGNVAIAAPAAFIPGANTVAGSGLIGAGMGLIQPAETGKERFLNTAAGGAFGAGGQAIGSHVVAPLARSRVAAGATRQAEESVRDATIREAQQLGYRVPVATINPESSLAQGLESVGGRAGTDQTFAWANQRVTDRLVKEDLGLSRRSQLTPAALNAVRARHGRVYEAIGQTGRITPDNQYLNDIAQLGGVLDDVAQEFPGAAAPSGDRIRQLADSLFQPDFDAGAAVKYIRELRQQAKSNFQAVHSAGGGAESLAIARAQRQAAGALEDMVLRNLRAQGNDALADSFDRARTLIAKSHDAETALVEGTGHIDALKLRSLLNRGKPLGGNMESIARVAQTLDRSMQHMTKGPAVSALSYMLGGTTALGGLALGNPAIMGAAALPLGRSVSRGIARSGPVQALARPSYQSPLWNVAQRVGPRAGPFAAGAAPTLTDHLWGQQQ